MATFKTTELKEFNEMLHNGIVEFQFIKKDGTLRQAKGTLLPQYLPPKSDSGEGSSRKPSDNVCVYFDMEKNAFRSFVKTSFVGAY